jgi:hypothetical protein
VLLAEFNLLSIGDVFAYDLLDAERRTGPATFDQAVTFAGILPASSSQARATSPPADTEV